MMDNDSFAAMHRLWCRQLQLEFEAICFQYGLEMRMPVFEITGAQKQLGCWLPRQRILQLSEKLILEYPWNVTLQVLRHEMAHQICSELFFLKESGHGPDFQQACELVGVTAPFRRSQGDLAGEIAADTDLSCRTAAGRRMLERIRKLLALAGSDNEHEAALAMQRAGELMARHNLQEAILDRAAGYSHCIINTGQKIIPSYRKDIAGILRDFFYVKVVCASLYDPRTDQNFRTIELLGRDENVPVAEHCYHFLEHRLKALWQENRHRFGGNARTARNSYYLGVLRGFSEKLASMRTPEASRQPSSSSSLAVMLTESDQALVRFVQRRFPRLRRRSGHRARIHADTYAAAVDTGRSLVLHGCMENGPKVKGGLLE